MLFSNSLQIVESKTSQFALHHSVFSVPLELEVGSINSHGLC